MLTNFIFLSILSAGSLYGAARFEKRFEETIAVSAMSMVLLLFLFGLIGYMAIGMVAIYIIAVLLYALTILSLVKRRKIRIFLKNVITPGSVFFAVFYIVLSVLNYGKLASSHDEFSHWVDIVKVVSSIDDFGTNPASASAFQSYPPGMVLFQYGLQKVHQLLKPDGSFSEWRVYFGYQIFVLAIFMPFLRGVTFRQPVRLMIYGSIALLAPLLFFDNLYQVVLIDPFVGILFGTGMAMVVLRHKCDWTDDIYICLLCAVLTLSKDVGLVFSTATALAFGIASMLVQAREGRKKRMSYMVTGFLFAYLPKLLWVWEVHMSNAAVAFGSKVDWRILLGVILGTDDSYRIQVVHSYVDGIFDMSIPLGNLFVRINYFGLLVVFIAAIYMVCRLYAYIYESRQQERCQAMAVVGTIVVLTLIGYVLVLCVIYMFKFSEYEALQLASMPRYLNIVFLGVWIMVLLLLSDAMVTCRFQKEAGILILTLILLPTPIKQIGMFIRGDYISDSAWTRASYTKLEKMIQDNCDGDDRIYFIAQESDGYEYLVCKFLARPNSLNNGHSWSIGEPFCEDDLWTEKINAQDWSEILFEEYDFVALYRTNDYFVQNFGSLFGEGEEIKNSTLYRVNRERGLLEMCGNQ